MFKGKMRRAIGIGTIGLGSVGVLAAFAARPEPERLTWSFGELRVPFGTGELVFIQADDSEVLDVPRSYCQSVTRSKLYLLDRLTESGWQLLEVDQTDHGWVYLLRRPNRYP